MRIPHRLELHQVLCMALAIFTAVRLTGQPSSGAPNVHVFFRVQAPPSDAPVSGRLLIFLKAGSGDTEVSTSEMHPNGAWICAREVRDMPPGSSVEVDADEIAFPRPFSSLPTGIYE